MVYLNRSKLEWAMCKFKRCRGRCAQAKLWIREVTKRRPYLLFHWAMENEPHESRGSRTVLWEPESASSSGYSTEKGGGYEVVPMSNGSLTSARCVRGVPHPLTQAPLISL